MLHKFSKPKTAVFHVQQAMAWFAKANSEKNSRKKWYAAYDQAANHMLAAIELGVPGDVKQALRVKELYSDRHGRGLR